MSKHGYYLHAPGYASRWGVVDVGLKCTHSCRFCFYAWLGDSGKQFEGMRHAEFHSRDHLLRLVDSLADNLFLGFDVTGGEPTLHPNIVDVVRRATERGLSSRIITLGQFLMRKMRGADQILVDQLLDAGLTDFRLSVHECEEARFKALTGGSWEKMRAAMDHLDGRNFQYMTNTTATADNYKNLPEIAREIAKHNVYMSTILFMMGHYDWSIRDETKAIQARYTDAAPYVREALAILEDAAIPVDVRYAPQCTIAGIEKNHVGTMGVRFDPHEWMNAIDHSAKPETITPEISKAMGRRLFIKPGDAPPGLALMRVDGALGSTKVVMGRGDANSERILKVFPSQCAKCSAVKVCDGIEPQYLKQHGASEFVPYVGDDRGNVLDRERLRYYPAFFQKRKADADIKKAIRRLMKPTPPSDSPKVSVIIPCHNYGRYLRECLNSVLAQTWRNLEIVIVNDASTDDTRQICDLLLPAARDSKHIITAIHRETNAGQPAPCRNQGIAASTGDLIVCLDADDRIAPSYIEECVRALQAHPKAAIAYPATQCFGSSDQLWAAAPYDFGQLIQQCTIVCASMFRREVWEEVGGFKENVKGMEDFAFWIEAGGLGFIGVPVPRALFQYRVHEKGLFQTHVKPNHEAQFRQIVLDNSDLYPASMVRLALEGKEVRRLIE